MFFRNTIRPFRNVPQNYYFYLIYQNKKRKVRPFLRTFHLFRQFVHIMSTLLRSPIATITRQSRTPLSRFTPASLVLLPSLSRFTPASSPLAFLSHHCDNPRLSLLSHHCDNLSAISFIAINRHRFVSRGTSPIFAVTCSIISGISKTSSSASTNNNLPAAQASKYTPLGL